MIVIAIAATPATMVMMMVHTARCLYTVRGRNVSSNTLLYTRFGHFKQAIPNTACMKMLQILLLARESLSVQTPEAEAQGIKAVFTVHGRVNWSESDLKFCIELHTKKYMVTVGICYRYLFFFLLTYRHSIPRENMLSSALS